MNKILSSTLLAGLAATSAQAAIVQVTSDITADATWSSSNEYILTDIIYVKGGATLTIEAGTIIRGEPSTGIGNYDPGALVITTAGRVNAQGTASDPIIFTTAALDSDSDGQVDGYDFFVDDNGTPLDLDDDADRVTATQTVVSDGVLQNGPFLDADPKNNPLPPAIYVGTGETDAIATFVDADGDTVPNEYRQLWGGVIILGEAPMNADVTSAGGLNRQFIEGLPEGDDSAFGGFNPNDNSGVFSYVSIRHGGAVIGSANEINGLTMGGVGFGTKIDHIDVYCNADDGYEWFGGTVNTKYLTSIFNNDDAFDIDSGFTGLGQFWFALMNADTVNGDKGGEHDGETGDGNDATLGTDFSIPKTYAVVYNATYIGNPNKATEPFRIRDNWGGEYHNSIFADFGGSDGIELESDGEARFTAGEVIFSGNTFYAADGSTTAADYGKAVTAGVETILDATFSSTFATTTMNFLANPSFPSMNRREVSVDASTGVNPVAPLAQATANNGLGGAFGVQETATFFDDVAYKGAFDTTAASTLWTTGWTALNIRGILVDRGDGLSL
ncbi:hypothetical protein [Coraliomargarita parva]|uniref:hypothetical protein n=1 Tax=Coraliomargarita parva TaxID=3014050 RepID=UPI0022B4FD59|nr:hypothetical protein [Coraliomargarita parva]